MAIKESYVDAGIKTTRTNHTFGTGTVDLNKKTWTCTKCGKQISIVLEGKGIPCVETTKTSTYSIPTDLANMYLEECVVEDIIIKSGGK